MRVDCQRARSFLDERLSDVLLFTGIAALVLGVMTFSLNTSLVSALGFFLGISLTGISIMAKTGVLAVEDSLTRKIGALLLLASVLFFAGAFVSFAVIGIGRILIPGANEILAANEGSARLNPSHHRVQVIIEHPLLGFTALFFSIGMCCAVLGAILKNR